MGKTAAQQNSGPEGDAAAAEARCVSSGEAAPLMWTRSEQFSAPFALIISWVSEVLSPSSHTQPYTQDTHINRKIAFFLCLTNDL